MFLALVLITGPGLIANTMLKDHWARPRPMHVIEFGGPARFTPVLARSGACERNCSFISGESSSIFAIGFAAAMLVRRRRAEFMAARWERAALIGLIRIGEGGHFLSDTIFAGVFMALDVALMHFLVFSLHRAKSARRGLVARKDALAAARAIRTLAGAELRTKRPWRFRARGPRR